MGRLCSVPLNVYSSSVFAWLGTQHLLHLRYGEGLALTFTAAVLLARALCMFCEGAPLPAALLEGDAR